MRARAKLFPRATGDPFYLLETTGCRLLSTFLPVAQAARDAANANELIEKFRIYKKMLMFFAAKLA